MGSAHIRTRKLPSGERRYDVRYRIGGRTFKTRHGGTFKTMALARARRDFILGELAAGRDPEDTLRETKTRVRTTVEQTFDAYIASRIDVSEKTKKAYRLAKESLGELASLEPAQVRAADIQEWVARQTHSRDTISHRLSTIARVLDYADVEPNPARSSRIKLPRSTRTEVSPPSGEEWALLREALAERDQEYLIARLMECVGMRANEVLALTWGDVDFANERFRISMSRTKGRTAGQRWIRVPRELLDDMLELTPPDDRIGRVFSRSEGWVRKVIAKACEDAGIASYSPHDLRHRRCSLWLLHGIDPLTASRWAGHSQASMTTDTYGHVLVSGDDEWEAFWRGVYVEERLRGEVRVIHEEGEE